MKDEAKQLELHISWAKMVLRRSHAAKSRLTTTDVGYTLLRD